MSKSFYSVLFISLLSFVFGCQKEIETRQVEVAAKGAEVMGFDLERTTHIFEKIEEGGRQQVVSDDNDLEQISLIQAHMEKISSQFAEGDFHDPEMIHGEHMSGLHELQMGGDRIKIEYSELENGGQILYTSDDDALVAAVHTWFDAQLSDHGHHAQENH